MSSGYVAIAASPEVPSSTTTTAIASGSASNLSFTSGQVSQFVTFIGTSDFHIRGASSTAAATAGDFLIKANTPVSYLIKPHLLFVSVIGGTGNAGTLYWALG